MASTVLMQDTNYPVAWSRDLLYKYSRVSFCDGSFYDSLLRPMSSRTGHSRLVGHYCRNSRALSLLTCASSSFPACMCLFFFYFSAVLLSSLWFFLSWHPLKRQKRRKNQNSWLKFLLDVYWTTAWAFFNKIKSESLDIIQLSVFFLYT